MNHRLGRAPGHAGGRRCIEAVFEYIEVKRTQIHNAIVVEGVVDAVELEPLISLEDFLDEVLELVESEPVQFLHLPVGDRIGRRIEIVQVAQQEPACVSDSAVRFAQPFQDVLGNADVVPVVFGGDPKAEYLGPVLADDFLGGYDVSERFGHLVSLAVNDEAVGEHGLVRSGPPGPDRRKKRGMKPSTVLIAALQVQVCGQPQFGLTLQDGRKGGP